MKARDTPARMYWTGMQDTRDQLLDPVYAFDLDTVNVTGSATSETSAVATPVAEIAEFSP